MLHDWGKNYKMDLKGPKRDLVEWDFLFNFADTDRLAEAPVRGLWGGNL